MRIVWQSGIDGSQSTIDSIDPETLASWLFEMADRTKGETGTSYQSMVTAWPSWVDGKTDWIGGGRTVEIRTPRELLKALGEQLDQAEGRQ